jgi:hypothetical protein
MRTLSIVSIRVGRAIVSSMAASMFSDAVSELNWLHSLLPKSASCSLEHVDTLTLHTYTCALITRLLCEYGSVQCAFAERAAALLPLLTDDDNQLSSCETIFILHSFSN